MSSTDLSTLVSKLNPTCRRALEGAAALCVGQTHYNVEIEHLLIKLIEEDGTVWQLVDETRRAWHAGLGFWAGTTDINARSIGIELQNPGHEFGYRKFPEAQMRALIDLARGILAPSDPARTRARPLRHRADAEGRSGRIVRLAAARGERHRALAR